MLKKLAYTDTNKAIILAEQAKLGFREIEDQRYLDGNWLIFDDSKPPVNWKVEWANAVTIPEKLSVLARVLHLE